jgi:hypothetical protein
MREVYTLTDSIAISINQFLVKSEPLGREGREGRQSSLEYPVDGLLDLCKAE